MDHTNHARRYCAACAPTSLKGPHRCDNNEEEEDNSTYILNNREESDNDTGEADEMSLPSITSMEDSLIVMMLMIFTS
eukprot:11673892-Ditylum_brightwellii.AAC.1